MLHALWAISNECILLAFVGCVVRIIVLYNFFKFEVSAHYNLWTELDLYEYALFNLD